MNPVIKLIIGVIIFLIGIYWYAAPLFGHIGLQELVVPSAMLGDGISMFESFRVLFAGIFGVTLIFFGLIVAWIEYEDLKWERKERKSKPVIEEAK